ncbi:MAG: YdcF family protein [Bacteroidota bacterium]
MICHGNPKAAELYQQGLSPVLVVTGENINPTLQALDIELIDAIVGQQALFDLGVDSAAVKVLPRGTNTFEESEEILGFSLAEGYRRIMVVSSKFHTRRIQRTFHKKFHAEGIEVRVIGAEPPEDTYLVDEWWKSEGGLIFVNNEYLKLIYYAWKY